MPTYARADIAFERGEGARLFTAEGRSYLDFAAGIAVTSLGHCHPHLVKALKDQSEKLWHTSNLYTISGQHRVAKLLIENSFAETVFFCNSGTEACEGVVKIIRHYHYHKGQANRNRIIVFEGAFHGRTLAMLAAGGQKKYLDGFAPNLEGFDRVPLGDLEAFKAMIGSQTAGVFIEPVQGEGGIRQVSLPFLQELRKICDEHDLLLAFDEVQSGIGRTGKLFAHQWADVSPDLVAIAKGLGGGFPVGAILASEKAATGMGPGKHGSTFGGNPLAMAVSEALLETILAPGFFDHVQEIGLYLHLKLEKLLRQFHNTILSEIRGRGLMLGIKTIPENQKVVAALLTNGLLTVAGGDNIVRILPPLIISEADVNDSIAIMETTFRELVA
jgi:acetylornithine/N-succinyldiaminopimelate aminotransferase